jgi:hypothetical protein
MYGEIKLAFFVYLWYPKTKVIPKHFPSGDLKKKEQKHIYII